MDDPDVAAHDPENDPADTVGGEIEGAIFQALDAVMARFGGVRSFGNCWVVAVPGDLDATVTVEVPVAVSTLRRAP